MGFLGGTGRWSVGGAMFAVVMEGRVGALACNVGAEEVCREVRGRSGVVGPSFDPVRTLNNCVIFRRMRQLPFFFSLH